MDPLTTAVVISVALMIGAIALTMRSRHHRELSVARVAALQEMVLMASGASAPLARSSRDEQDEDEAVPVVSEDDDWDRRLHAEGYDDIPEYDDVPEAAAVAMPAAVRAPEVERPAIVTMPAEVVAPAPVVTSVAARVVTTRPQFVVQVPDEGARWQVSFQQIESES